MLDITVFSSSECHLPLLSRQRTILASSQDETVPPNPLRITLSNGTHFEVEWKAIYNWFNLGFQAPPRALPFNSTEVRIIVSEIALLLPKSYDML